MEAATPITLNVIITIRYILLHFSKTKGKTASLMRLR